MDLVNRGDIWLVTLDPTVGSEIKKTRPCLIVSPDELNRRIRTVIIVPLTTGSGPAPFRVPTTFQGKAGFVLPEQIRAVDKDRLIRRLGAADDTTISAVLSVLEELFAE